MHTNKTWYVHFTSKSNIASIRENGLLVDGGTGCASVNGSGVYAYRIGSVYDCTTGDYTDSPHHVAIAFRTEQRPFSGSFFGTCEIKWKEDVRFLEMHVLSPAEAYTFLNAAGFGGSKDYPPQGVYVETYKADKALFGEGAYFGVGYSTGEVDDYGDPTGYPAGFADSLYFCQYLQGDE